MCLLGWVPVHGQFSHLLHKPYAQRAEAIKQIYHQVLEAPSAEKAYAMIDAFAAFARRSGDKELQFEARLMKAFYRSKQNVAREQVVAGFEAVIADAKQQGITQIAARGLDVLGQYYWHQVGNYELAFEHYIGLAQVLATMPDEAYPDKMASLRSISYAYYHFGDYRDAIAYLKRASLISITDFNRHIYFDVLNTIGLCYQKLGQLDSASFYFHAVIDPRRVPPDAAWQNIARGNLGYNQFLLKNYEAAIPLLQADINGATKAQDWGLASGSLMPLAAIYLQQNDMAKASTLARQAQEYVRRSGQFQRYQHLYPLLAKLHAAQGEAALAARYVDSAVMVKDSLSRQFNALQLLRAHQRVELQQKMVLQANLNYQKKLKIIERNALLALVGLLLAGLVYVYYNTRRKLQHEKALKALQLREKEKELEQAAGQLHRFAESIQEKNRLIESLEQQFGTAGNNSILQELRQSTILTDEEWEKFRTLFEQVHSGYLERLRYRFPHLTPSETRFMVLSRLHFSNKEMAAALGVSTQSVRTIWYRIRKKHNLPEVAGQEELAVSI